MKVPRQVPIAAPCTGDEEWQALRERSRAAGCVNVMRNHGASVSEEIRHRGPTPYLLPDFDVLGFNYRMTDLQAAVGCVQLRKLNRFIAERQQWADYYRRELVDLD